MEKPLPCPCCGNAVLYTGPNSSDSECVHCQDAYNFVHESLGNHLLRMGKVKVSELDEPHFQGCGLRMVVQVPDEFPDSMCDSKGRLRMTTEEALEKLRELTLAEAIKRWNKRVTQLTTQQTKSEPSENKGRKSSGTAQNPL